MNTVEHPMDSYYLRIVREPVVFTMEEESVKYILCESPENKTNSKISSRLKNFKLILKNKVCDQRNITNRNSVPRGSGKEVHERI